MARRLPVGQVGGISNLTDRLYYVDSAGTFADRDFCFPNGFIQIGGQVDIGCNPVPLTDVQKIAGLDQISWLQLSPCAMVEPLRLQIVGDAKTAFMHIWVLLICNERLTVFPRLTRKR